MDVHDRVKYLKTPNITKILINVLKMNREYPTLNLDREIEKNITTKALYEGRILKG